MLARILKQWIIMMTKLINMDIIMMTKPSSNMDIILRYDKRKLS